MHNAKISKEIKDTDYKDGYVHCDGCEWHHDLGDGFNQTHIESCPNCDDSIDTRTQRKVIYWDEHHKALRADVGTNKYFVIDNGIHVRYVAENLTIHRHLTERQADRI